MKLHTPPETTDSYWLASSPSRRFPAIDRDLSVDVVVVGAGLAGVTAAYLLKRAGCTVVLLDRGQAGHADTGLTTAHLTAVTDTRLSGLVKAFGEDHARAAWDAGFAALAQIEACVLSEHIDCGFRWVPGYLHASSRADTSHDETAALQQEAGLARSLGFAARYLDAVPFFDTPGVEFSHQARFHPQKYLAALLATINGGGSYVFEDSPAERVDARPLAVVANGRDILCGHVVVATHNPVVGKAGVLGATLLQTKLALYNSYAVGGRTRSGVVPDALFWDTADPYHYLRVDPQADHDYVLFGGEDHKTGQERDTRVPLARLEQAVERLAPQIEIVHRWSGQVIETNDGLPFIGETSEGQFTATGFGGNGMTFGTLGAMMACDWVMGCPNPWSELFDVARTKIRGGLWDYLKENSDYPYYMIRDRFARPESQGIRDVARGTGAIVAIDGMEVAAYRADDGAVTLLSPVCPHMGCHVGWNTAERTWDCPCHGSRFAATGAVSSGPAEAPLSLADTPHTHSIEDMEVR